MKMTIRICEKAEGNYRAWCPALPGCTVSGRSPEEAKRKIEEAVRSYLASMNATSGELQMHVLSA
jgi:predicted RNase H-like HicB family nuclease